MPIVFAAAMGHAPGITAWKDAPDPVQRDRIYDGFAQIRAAMERTQPEQIVFYTSEHWANFFLDHVSPFCVGRGEHFEGPPEPWLKIEKRRIPGNPALASALIEAAYEAEVDVGFGDELALDHGTMIPLHFLRPQTDLPVVPIFINTLAAPQPSARRCIALGRAVAEVLRRDPKRTAVIATGGMSHDPGERNHGVIVEAFDRQFLDEMVAGDMAKLGAYSVKELLAAGAGAVELLAWIALAGTLGRFSGEVVAYEPIKAWATGLGMMILHAA